MSASSLSMQQLFACVKAMCNKWHITYDFSGRSGKCVTGYLLNLVHEEVDNAYSRFEVFTYLLLSYIYISHSRFEVFTYLLVI